jgi:hypothetical protein
MLFQVVDIEFDFDDADDEDWGGHPIPKQEIIDEVTNTIWEASDEEDLVEEITCATGWCIKTFDYIHVLK